MLKQTIKILLLLFIMGFGFIIKLYTNQINLFNEFQIKITGNNFINKEQILEHLTPYTKKSLLSLDLKIIKKNINQIEYIESSQISKVLPHTLIIKIIEKEPILLIVKEDEQYFMDKKGILINTNYNSINYFPVPVVISNNKYDDKQDLKIIFNLFDFILKDYPTFYENISEIEINQENWIFYFDFKTKIYANSDNLHYQINILKNFEKTIYPKKFIQDYKYIDLRIAEQIIVKEKNQKG
tara:strand:- start:1583 stop:2302 length:720 start_codon:yes stop_codon:yes gene_type:complete